ncbi:Protein BTR1 (Binding to ToMV RNA 1) [Durusdinium trenchii]|uniref:Protein BTR1 (Binding to ToMV RNA 1) n=1 Tax=Durusdinium trenchii TaxID=1381693 RepID=A0ABP0LJE5_9DINO
MLSCNTAFGSGSPPPEGGNTFGSPPGNGSFGNESDLLENPLSVWGLSLPGTTVKSNDYAQALLFIMRCKDNDAKEAESFLRGTLKLLLGKEPSVALKGDEIEDEKADREFASFHGDDTDDKPTTLVLLVPGQAHIIGHLIGKAGAEITKLESSANVSIRVESKSKMPLGSSERRIFIVGSVANCVFTQQRITQRIHEKLREEGVKQELIKIVIPHESVPHLIGKGGSSIKRLQEQSSARIQVEQETSVVPGTIGRAVTIQGSRYERSMAQYLISRQMAENRSTRKEWQGGVPQPSSLSPQNFPTHMSPPLQSGLDESNAKPGGHKGDFFLPADLGSQVVGGGDAAVSGSGSTRGTRGSSVDSGSNLGFGGNGKGRKCTPISVQPKPRLRYEVPFNAAAFDSNAVQQYERYVPDNAVAHLIGRAGAVISDIQKKSGTRISFSKNGSRATEANPKLAHVQRVTIVGTPYAIQLAQQMISKKIIEHVGEDFERM